MKDEAWACTLGLGVTAGFYLLYSKLTAKPQCVQREHDGASRSACSVSPNSPKVKPFDDSYFKERNGVDLKRKRAAELEAEFMRTRLTLDGVVLDVGCSTGEFLEYIEWKGDKYGMEVNEQAVELAKGRGVMFDRDLTAENYFDAIVFRGTIQHVDTPFLYMKQALQALKPGGHIVFLATPNADGWYYWLWRTVPFWKPDFQKKRIVDTAGGYVYYVPSEMSLCSTLQHYGFEEITIENPYWGGPYSNPILDYVKFFFKLIRLWPGAKFAFPGNMMNVIAQKPGVCTSI